MFSWFLLRDADGNVSPLYTGYERISEDGTQFLMHDNLAEARGAKLAKTSTMPSALTIQSRLTAKTLVLTEALCTKDEVQTKELIATPEWSKADVVEATEVIVEKVR